MSLLIDALKKHRKNAGESLSSPQEKVVEQQSPRKVGKIIMMSVIIVMLVGSTALVSFLLFKHAEKKRMIAMLQSKLAEQGGGKLKALLAEKEQGKVAGSSDKENMQAMLREKMQEKMQAQSSSSAESNVSQSYPASVSSAASVDNTTASTSVQQEQNTQPEQSSVAQTEAPTMPSSQNFSGRFSNNGQGGGRFAGGRRSEQSSPMMNRSNSDASESNTVNDVSNNNDVENNDTVVNDNAEAENNSNTNGVNIQLVSDQVGEENPVYQKALALIKNNQNMEALALLENDDDLVVKTQGLSALLLARIYLSLDHYGLAEEAAEHALSMRAGSEADLIALKAQALFMQKRYHEVLEVLSSASPDLSTAPEYYALLAETYMSLHQPQNAVSVFQQIVARFPNVVNYWLGLALAYQKAGEGESAVVAYRRAAQLSENDPQVMLFINQQIAAIQAV